MRRLILRRMAARRRELSVISEERGSLPLISRDYLGGKYIKELTFE
jgi:hypothetical protein